jgi:cytochrome c peroxidase
LSVQRGGAYRDRDGLRAAQSLMYTQTVPPFTEHYSDDEDDDSIDQGPVGGRTWDGRAQSAHEQALEPLLSPLEMANHDKHAIAARLRKTANIERFTAAFGKRGMDDDARLLRAALMALETFQQEPALFYPYTSKYDAWLRHQVGLSPQELRGLAVFNDPTKGNCARCHSSGITESGLPQFTDYGYAALGVPRNRALPANRDPHYYDLGLCGPLRRDLADKKHGIRIPVGSIRAAATATCKSSTIYRGPTARTWIACRRSIAGPAKHRRSISETSPICWPFSRR